MRIFHVLFKGAKAAKQSEPLRRGNVGIFNKVFNKYLFVTNTVSSSLLMGIGDYVQQRIEQYQHKPAVIPYDTLRTKNLMIVATGHGVYHHYFYSWVDRVVPYSTARGVIYKILLDQFIAGPVCLIMFFFGMGLLNTGKLKEGLLAGWEEFKEKFLFVYTVDWIVWPPAQFLNFYYLPYEYRVIYINMITMMYNVFLSYAKHYYCLITAKL